MPGYMSESPPETVGWVRCVQANSETKMACAQASTCLRDLTATARLWKDEVRLDLRDARQLLWLERHCPVRQPHGRSNDSHSKLRVSPLQRCFSLPASLSACLHGRCFSARPSGMEARTSSYKV